MSDESRTPTVIVVHEFCWYVTAFGAMSALTLLPISYLVGWSLKVPLYAGLVFVVPGVLIALWIEVFSGLFGPDDF